MFTVLLVIHTILVLFLIAIILLQRSDADGLSGLGGGGGNQFMTGRAQANLLTRTTAILAALFIASSLALGVMGGSQHKGSIADTIEAQSEPKVKEQSSGAEKPVEKEKPKAAPSVPKPE